MSPFRRLLPYVLRHRRDITLGLLATLAATAIQLAGPWILKFAIDDLTRSVTSAKLLLYGTLTLGVAVFGGVFRYTTRRLLMGASRDIEYDLRNDFFAHLQRLSLGYYQAHRTGDLMSRATNDLSAVRMMVGPAVMYASSTVILFVVAIALMLSINVKLTLIALLPLPFVSISVKYFGDAIHRRFEKIQEQLSDLSAIAQETLAGVRVVRAYRQEPAEIARFRVANETYLDRNRSLIRLQGVFFPSMTFFLGLAALVVLWLGGRDVILHRITVGEFVAFNAYLAMLSWPMIAFGWVTNLLQRGMASWKRMLDILDEPPAIRDAAGLKPVGEFVAFNAYLAMLSWPMIAFGWVTNLLQRGMASWKRMLDILDEPPAIRDAAGLKPAGEWPAIRGAIDIRHLNFSYGDRRVLTDINLSIEAGQTVAIIGPTGSGKSTLISLLPRLHEPPAGTVFLDGVDVRDLPLEVLRGAIGMVPQEPFLFSETVAENIKFGAPQRDEMDAILDAAGVARLDKDVDAFPKSWDTMVGERGLTLSGGQKQRTALARALLINPPVLILDDALSAVDTYTEEEILSKLRGVMRQRTSIIVAHRVSTVRHADLIVVLEDGRIVERGRHDELVMRGGPYSEMYRKQLLEDELAAS